MKPKETRSQNYLCEQVGGTEWPKEGNVGNVQHGEKRQMQWIKDSLGCIYLGSIVPEELNPFLLQEEGG
jgi:hypothetical protein